MRILYCVIYSVVTLLSTVKARDTVPSIVRPDRVTTDILIEPDIYVLQCKATGNPQPTYKWTFNGEDTTDAMTVDTTSGNLTIEGFTVKEEGRYQCLAESTVRGKDVVVMSPVITLRKARLDLDWNTEPSEVSAHLGSYLQLTCDNPPHSVPSGSFEWYRSTDSGEKNIEETERIHVDAQGSLHLLSVTRDDAVGYKCAVFNPSLQIIKLGSEKHVRINETRLGGDGVTLRYKTNSSTKFLLSSSAELECVYSGESDPEVSWYNKGGKISNSKKYQLDGQTTGRRLVVTSLTEEDEGNYTCRSASGREGHVWLDVTSSPFWVKRLGNQIVPENREARFLCKARPVVGDPPLNPPTWLLNGRPLVVDGSSKFSLSEAGTVLTVRNLNKSSDVMCFQCTVSNHIGEEYGDGCLQVIEPIRLDVFPDPVQNVSKGEIINLTVTGSGDPDFPFQYRWHLNGEAFDMTGHPNMIYNEDNKEAYINTSTLNDEEYNLINGTYQIELYNEYDRVVVYTQVVLESTVEPVVVVEEEVTVVPVLTAGTGRGHLWWISIVIAVILLVIVVIIIVVICKRRAKKKRSYNTKKGDKNHILENTDPEEPYASRLSIEPESLDTEADGQERDTWSLDLDTDDDIDPTDFNEDGSFIGGYELSRVSLNHI